MEAGQNKSDPALQMEQHGQRISHAGESNHIKRSFRFHLSHHAMAVPEDREYGDQGPPGGEK